MTLIRPFDEDATAGALLEVAEEHFNHAIEELNRVLLDLDEEGLLPQQEIRRVASDIRKTVLVLFEERNRIEQARKRTKGVVHDYALDLDSARADIGRRLACLRNAGRTGDVPEQPG